MHSISQHPMMGGWVPRCGESHDEAITDANRHVELVLRWRNRVVDVKRVRDVDAVSVGRSADDDVKALVPSFAVLQRVGAQWLVNVPNGVAALAQQDGRSATVGSGAGTVRLSDGMALTLDLGAHTLQVRTVARTRAMSVPAVFDALWANTSVVVLAGVVALLAALWWQPADVGVLGVDMLSANASTYRAVLLAPAPKDNAFLQHLQSSPPHANGDHSEVPRRLMTTPRAGKQGADVLQPPRSDHEVVADQLRVLFGDGSGVGQVFGADNGGALNVALHGVASTKVASLTPELRGAGGLGDGTATGTISVGAIHTRGGRDMIDIADGGGFGKKVDHDIVMLQTPVCLLGVFDPELIRSVVRAHLGQVRYCYERALTSTPGLAGRVNLQWTITPEGHVSASSIESSTLHSQDVEACLMQRAKTWRFPRPKDAGVVVVKYPFVFHSAGQ